MMMEDEDEECFDADEEFDESEEDWCTASYGGEECCHSEECGLEISAPRRSVNIVVGRSTEFGSSSEGGTRELQFCVPRRKSVRLVFGRSRSRSRSRSRTRSIRVDDRLQESVDEIGSGQENQSSAAERDENAGDESADVDSAAEGEDSASDESAAAEDEENAGDVPEGEENASDETGSAAEGEEILGDESDNDRCLSISAGIMDQDSPTKLEDSREERFPESESSSQGSSFENSGEVNRSEDHPADAEDSRSMAKKDERQLATGEPETRLTADKQFDMTTSTDEDAALETESDNKATEDKNQLDANKEEEITADGLLETVTSTEEDQEVTADEKLADASEEGNELQEKFDDANLAGEHTSAGEENVPELDEIAKTPLKKSLRFADTRWVPRDTTPDPEEQEDAPAAPSDSEQDDDAPVKKSLRFADTSDTDKKETVKKSLRFADVVEAPVKRSLRFAEPNDAAPPPSKRKKTDRRKSVRFSDDPLGQSRKFSLDASVVVRKNVRFLLPAIDRTGKETVRVFFPGVIRKRRATMKATTVNVYPDPPLWLVLYMMDTKRFSHLSGKRRAKAWKIFAWTTGVVCALAGVSCLGMLCLYLHMHPRIPRCRIIGMNILDFAIWPLAPNYILQQQLEDRGNYFAYEFYLGSFFLVNYQNDNKEVDIYNDYAEITLFYKGTEWGKASLKDFLVRRMSEKVLKFEVWNILYLRLNIGYTLIKEYDANRFDLVCEFVVKARMTDAAQLTTSRHFWLRVRCYIVLSINDILSEDCKNYNY